VPLTTQPPGAAPPSPVPEPPPALLRELRALIEQVRAIAIAREPAAARVLPPLPDTGGGQDPSVARWFRTALGPGGLGAAELKGLVEEAFQRLAATGAEPAAAARPLEAARETALRLVAAAVPEAPGAVAGAGATADPSAPLPVAIDQALALRVLAEEVRNAVVAATGAAPPFVAAPAAADDPGNAGAALLGWLRTAAQRAGVPLATLEPAIDAGLTRALAVLPEGTSALAAALAGAREVIGRGLEAARAAPAAAALVPPVEEPPNAAGAVPAGVPAGGGIPQAGGANASLAVWLRGEAGRAAAAPAADLAARMPLFGPGATTRPAAGPRGRAADQHERVPAIGEGEDDGAARRRRPDADDGPAPGHDERAEAPTEGPMQCIRGVVETLLAGDAAGFTALWVYPACFWIDGRWLGCADAGALATLQARILRGRRERGVTGGRILLLRVDPVGDRVALVHALLAEERDGQASPREVEALYTTVRTEGGWRVAVAVTK
jgi:hypothetical protein